MGEGTKIEWCHHTFNPWWGCARVSPGCEHCYAESFSKRTGHKIWGVQYDRRFFGDAHWAEPLKWNAKAEREGERRRVFCASMADVFERRDDLIAPRARLRDLIHATPWLDWLILTKRPENAGLMPAETLALCWFGVTAEDQRRAVERLAHLEKVRARVRFLSCEPLLGDLDLFGPAPGKPAPSLGAAWAWWPGHRHEDGVDCEARVWPIVHWVIVGSESGPGARPMDIEWARSIVRQCRVAGVRCFVKQIANDKDRKGGNPEHWPPGDWPREFPEVRA